MYFSIVLPIALLLMTCYVVQCTALWFRSSASRREGRKRARDCTGEFMPTLVSLEAQYFLAPKQALIETRRLFESLDVPVDCLAGVTNLKSFSRALDELQALLCLVSAQASPARERASSQQA